MAEEIVVVGGGISGVCFAHYCAVNGYKVKLYEKHRPGGCLDSKSIDRNYFFELGGHTLTYKYKTLLEMLAYYDATAQLIKIPDLKFETYRNGRFQSLFKNMGFGSLFWSLPKAMGSSKTGKTIRTYYSSILGKKNYARLFHYLFRAILCQDPDEFPAELLFKKRKANKQYPRKFALKKGVQQLVDIVLQNPNIQSYHETPVTRISGEQGKYELWFGNQLLTVASAVCFACPSATAAKLLHTLHPETAQKLATLSTAKIDTLLVHVKDKECIADRHKSILCLDQSFYAAIYHHVEGEKYWVFHFDGNKHTTIEKVRIIARIFGTDAHNIQPISERQSELPRLTLAGYKVVREVEKQLTNPGIYLATNYMEGLAIEDCCVRAKKEALRFVNGM